MLLFLSNQNYVVRFPEAGCGDLLNRLCAWYIFVWSTHFMDVAMPRRVIKVHPRVCVCWQFFMDICHACVSHSVCLSSSHRLYPLFTSGIQSMLSNTFHRMSRRFVLISVPVKCSLIIITSMHDICQLQHLQVWKSRVQFLHYHLAHTI